MKRARYLRKALVAAFLVLSFEADAQSDSIALNSADTSQFSPNQQGNWRIYNAFFLDLGADSVQLELILRQDQTLDWGAEHYIGRIKNPSYVPQSEQSLSFVLVNNTYSVRIDSIGKCYLKQLSGAPPVEAIVVVPVRINFHK
ncbi:MAG: hypothetical protein SFU20_09450 [Chitinophagaceae bacterium]|nr:hypothetical protein [Chitinophagaceae bacterium]